jgi:hypothetical protein
MTMGSDVTCDRLFKIIDSHHLVRIIFISLYCAPYFFCLRLITHLPLTSGSFFSLSHLLYHKDSQILLNSSQSSWIYDCHAMNLFNLHVQSCASGKVSGVTTTYIRDRFVEETPTTKKKIMSDNDDSRPSQPEEKAPPSDGTINVKVRQSIGHPNRVQRPV